MTQLILVLVPALVPVLLVTSYEIVVTSYLLLVASYDCTNMATAPFKEPAQRLSHMDSIQRILERGVPVSTL